MTSAAYECTTFPSEEPGWSESAGPSIADRDDPYSGGVTVFCVYNTQAVTWPDIEADGVQWATRALLRLGEVGRLPDNWDERGSPRIDWGILEAARSLLSRLSGTVSGDFPCPDVCPIAGGTLQFEWTLGRKHVEIEFVDAERVVVLTEESTLDGPAIHTEELALRRVNRIRQVLDWLASP